VAGIVTEVSLTLIGRSGDSGSVLELRPTCEHCDRPLPPGALDARICSFECTFCAACADDLLGGVCPNCTGELLARPVRPAELLGGAAAGPERTHSPAELRSHTEMRAGRPREGDHAGVVLRRYVDCWRNGDLDGLMASYAPGFRLHYGGTSRFAGSHEGRDAALGIMAEVSTVAHRDLLSVDDVLVSDRGGALVVTERLSREGESVDVQRVLRYRVEDGLLAECWLMEADQVVIDHFWR
jgi:hypothetical protein